MVCALGRPRGNWKRVRITPRALKLFSAAVFSSRPECAGRSSSLHSQNGEYYCYRNFECKPRDDKFHIPECHNDLEENRELCFTPRLAICDISCNCCSRL